MTDWRPIQQRLGIVSDGHAGPVTYGALFIATAARDVPIARELGASMALNAEAFGVDTPARLAAFLAQTCHESGGFRWLREIWGPGPAQRRYEGRAALGNNTPGDGYRFLGRGLIQLTGRANYRLYGELLGLDLEANPSLAEKPGTAVLTALAFWKDRKLNRFADAGDFEGLTRRINGGTNGLADRLLFWKRAKEVLL